MKAIDRLIDRAPRNPDGKELCFLSPSGTPGNICSRDCRSRLVRMFTFCDNPANTRAAPPSHEHAA